jgi:hypothetical protein
MSRSTVCLRPVLLYLILCNAGAVLPIPKEDHSYEDEDISRVNMEWISSVSKTVSDSIIRDGCDKTSLNSFAVEVQTLFIFHFIRYSLLEWTWKSENSNVVT